MEHLIANSGIQFVTTELEFNPSEPLVLDNGKTLKYNFLETVDLLSQEQVFDMLFLHRESEAYLPLDEIRNSGAYVKLANGREDLDAAGLLRLLPEENADLYTHYSNEDAEVYGINSLYNYRVKDPADGKTPVMAWELLLNHWLPMPMFERELDGVSAPYPVAWCRVKVERIGAGGQKGMERYRFLWAFDTQLGEDTGDLRPFFVEGEADAKDFGLCRRADALISDFLFKDGNPSAFADYIYSLLGCPKEEHNYKYLGYYIYLVNFIRLSKAAPEVTLHHNGYRDVPVDLVLDIGNSRTCGILFENGDFTKAKMLGLRDLSHPERVYEKSFDMRLVFRMADFGNDIVLNEDLFTWKSFVRIGDEAKHLVYRSLEEDGLSMKATNYSSPKRYLWDNRPFDGNWENLNTVDDPYNIRLSNNIYVPGLSDMFDAEGNYLREGETGLSDLTVACYSRSSLMIFVLIEILQQAMSQINAVDFRDKHGNVDCRRVLRNIILTCPTAMPRKEQIRLRECAEIAYDALKRTIPALGEAHIFPTSESLKITDDFDDSGKRMWAYDEASCCQLVYLYAEIAQRYNGEVSRFFEMKGHVRPEEKEAGYEGNSLTIGSIDIGAGTTDIMISSYQCAGQEQSLITPIPLYWDSFYLAGDDILHNMVQNLVIEGKNSGVPNQGNITNALTLRILNMNDEELRTLPCLAGNKVYQGKINNLLRCAEREEKEHLLRSFASNLVHDFFGWDSSMMSFKDRRCRLDFNTQISVPIAQFFLELLRTKRASRVFSFQEIFEENAPSSYLLDDFARHFGFRFESLEWRFDPVEVAEVVKNTMEPLLKQLAVVLYAHHCDIILLAGRPTSLDAVTELFIKYASIAPNRLIRLNDYRVGSWFPTADGLGYFYDQKSIVAVGGMIGYLASHEGLPGLGINFKSMIRQMKSTAHYLGEFNSHRQQVPVSLLSPTNSAATFDFPVFPAFIGCKLLDSAVYQARPLFAVYNKTGKAPLKISVSRNYHDDPEALVVENVQDATGEELPTDQVEIVQQSLVNDGRYWLDKGEFDLFII